MILSGQLTDKMKVPAVKKAAQKTLNAAAEHAWTVS